MENPPLYHIGHGKQSISSILVNAGEAVTNEQERAVPHRHMFYSISLVLNGGGAHIIDFESYEIVPNRAFLVKPGQVHAWQAGRDSRICLIQFTDEIFIREPGKRLQSRIGLVTGFGFKPYLDLNQDQADHLKLLFENIQAEEKLGDIHSGSIISNYVQIILNHWERYVLLNKQRPLTRQEQLLEQFQRAIEENYQNHSSVGIYAEKLNVTPNYLNIITRKIANKSANHLIKERVLLEAKRHLIFTSDDISEIAYQLNFSDPSYFTKFFRKFTGMSPGKFREENYKYYR